MKIKTNKGEWKTLKAFASVLILLAVVPGVLAALITPSNPDTTANLAFDISNPSQYVYKWFRDGVELSGETGSTLSSSYTSRGNTILAEAYLNILGDLVFIDNAQTTIVNAVPSTPTVYFSQNSYFADSNITVTASSTDADNDALTYTYTFYVNGSSTPSQNSTSNVFNCLGSCNKGGTVSVTVVANDGFTNSNSASNQTSIVNSPPVIGLITVLPSTVLINSTLNVTASVLDVDGDNLTTTFQFYNLNDSSVLQNFSSNNLLNLSINDAHNTIRVTVNSTDGANVTSSFTDVVVSNSLPLWSLGNLSFNQDTNLSVNFSGNVSDLENDSLNFSAVGSQNITASLNGTTLTLVPDSGFIGTQTVNLTADDGFGNSTQVLSITVFDTTPPVLNITAPTNGQLFNTTNNVTLTFTVSDNGVLDTCRYTSSFDSGGNLNCTLGSYNFTNMVNGNHSVTVFANDSRGNSANQTVNFTVNFNSAPSIASLNLTPSSPTTANNLNATFNLTDVQQTSLTAFYNWYNNGVLNQSGSTSATSGALASVILSSGNTSKGQNWTFELIPSDGLLNGTAQNVSLVVVNTAPTSSNISAQTWQENQNLTLNLSLYFSDADSDDLSFTSTSPANITVLINNSTNTLTLVPDANFVGKRNLTITGFDTENANVTSNTFDLYVGFSVVINSYVNGTFYPTGNYTNIAGLETSTLNVSNITGPTISVLDSTITNSTIVDSSMNNCTVTDSTVIGSPCLNAVIDPSDVRYSNATGSTVLDSTIHYSNATNSFVNQTSIYNSSIDGSNMTLATLTNVTMTGSTVLNSTLSNTVIGSANITNGVVYSGTILMANGSTYNATSQGALNLTSAVNYAPNAVISSPISGSFNTGSAISFVSGSTDSNVGGSLNDTLTFFWNFGDGTNATTENATHTYSSDGVYTVVLTVTDRFNSTDNATVTLTLSTPSSGSGGSGGGGGGGGGSSTPAVFTVTLTEPVSKDLSVGQSISFDFLGEKHSVTLEQVTQTNVRIKVQSTPVFATLAVGETGKFDLNGDGIYDLAVTLEQRLSSLKAKLKFALISEPIEKAEVKEEPKEEEKVEETEETEAEETQTEEETKFDFKSLTGKVTETLSKVSKNTWISVGAVVALLILTFLLYRVLYSN